jgi:hypothetical protein
VFSDFFRVDPKNFDAVRRIAVAAIPDIFAVNRRNFDALRQIAVVISELD